MERDQKTALHETVERNLVMTDIFINEYHSYPLNTIIARLGFEKNNNNSNNNNNNNNNNNFRNNKFQNPSFKFGKISMLL